MPPLILGVLSAPDIGDWIVPQLAYFAFNLAVGAALIAFRSPLAATFLSPDDDAEISDLTLDRFEQFAIILLGVWFVANAVAVGVDIEVGRLINFEQHREFLDPGASRGRALTSASAWQDRMRYLPHLVLAFYLLLQAPTVQAWSARTRVSREQP